MLEFHTSLLREKFVITDIKPATTADAEPVIALSNRIALNLKANTGTYSENFIVRAQNMPSCLRMAARIASEFDEKGSVLKKSGAFNWEDAYQTMIKGYEEKWNPDNWVAIYNIGRIVFEGGTGKRHPFLDIIEQCDARNKDDYENTLKVAEDAFKQAGKTIHIEHDTNVANIINISGNEVKCGVVLRGPANTTTFNFSAKSKLDWNIKPSQCLNVSAAFLEGIQLAFFVGMTDVKVDYELIDKHCEEAKKANEARDRITRLTAAILQYEKAADVNYRPQKPNFPGMIAEAKEFAKKELAKELKEKIVSGEQDGWIE